MRGRSAAVVHVVTVGVTGDRTAARVEPLAPAEAAGRHGIHAFGINNCLTSFPHVFPPIQALMSFHCQLPPMLLKQPVEAFHMICE